MLFARHRALWGLTAGQRARYGGAMAVMALETLLILSPPLVVLAVVDGVLGKDVDSELGRLGARAAEALGARPALWWAGGLSVVLTLGAGLCLYLRGRWTARASEAIVRRLREALFRHLDRLPCRYHDHADTGDLVQRCSSDVETLRVFLATQIVEIGRAGLLVLLAVPILAALDGPMTLVATGLLPVIVGFALLCFRPIRRVFTAMDEAEAAMTSTLQENLTGIRVVRAFGRQEHERQRFGVAAGEFRDQTQDFIRRLGGYWATSDLLCFVQLALALFVGAQRHLDGDLSLGTLVTFLSILGLVLWPVRQSGRVLADSGKAVVALDRIEAVLDEPEEPASEGHAPADPRGCSLSLRGLTFAYDADAPVLSDVDVDVAPGETLALVGPPGAGKSTLVQLLLRLYDGYTGSIRLDGVELSSLARRSVRERIAVVLQEPFLYSRSIAENLRGARPDADEQALREAVTAADLARAVDGFRDGLETRLGERGVTLSGGQRQRLAIARAWLRDAPLLILDDALSAVDTATEARILEALRARAGRCTTLIVAHRLSCVAHADHILVLDAGRVVEAGDHATLLAHDGPYARLWRVQAGLEAELRGTIGEGPSGAAPSAGPRDTPGVAGDDPAAPPPDADGAPRRPEPTRPARAPAAEDD